MPFEENRETILIGDIHGQAATLAALLDRLGWKRRGGRLRGPAGSGLVFVGDLIDRGPENRRTVETVRELIEQGDAICMLGNHEYNAVQFHTEDPDKPGAHLREHSEKNIKQHEKVLEEFANDPGGLKEMNAWFRTLPVAAQGPNWRCVHACWSDDHLARLDHADGFWRLPATRWTAAARPAEPEYKAIDILTKGMEHPLPDGVSFPDKDDNPRREARVRWWVRRPRTFGEALMIPAKPKGLDLEREFDGPDLPGYPDNAPPVFFGHYWNRGDIDPERPNAVCLDYSAGFGEKLVAYRLGNEKHVDPARFVVQKVIE